MKQLTISNSEFCAIVDDKNYERLREFTWFVDKRKGRVFRQYFIPIRGAYRTTYKKMYVSLANEVMQNVIIMYDHRDRDGFNNQEENLRLSSYAQNAANRSKSSNTSSSYKGVSWDKERCKWYATIRKGGKQLNLGRFDDEVSAAKAYDKKANELFGEFAALNFPVDL